MSAYVPCGTLMGPRELSCVLAICSIHFVRDPDSSLPTSLWQGAKALSGEHNATKAALAELRARLDDEGRGDLRTQVGINEAARVASMTAAEAELATLRALVEASEKRVSNLDAELAWLRISHRIELMACMCLSLVLSTLLAIHRVTSCQREREREQRIADRRALASSTCSASSYNPSPLTSAATTPRVGPSLPPPGLQHLPTLLQGVVDSASDMGLSSHLPSASEISSPEISPTDPKIGGKGRSHAGGARVDATSSARAPRRARGGQRDLATSLLVPATPLRNAPSHQAVPSDASLTPSRNGHVASPTNGGSCFSLPGAVAAPSHPIADGHSATHRVVAARAAPSGDRPRGDGSVPSWPRLHERARRGGEARASHGRVRMHAVPSSRSMPLLGALMRGGLGVHAPSDDETSQVIPAHYLPPCSLPDCSLDF